MTNESTFVIEDESLFSPISQLNYSFYKAIEPLLESLKNNEEIQCIAGVQIPFGKTQCPALNDYADGIDTLQFLLTL